MNIQSDRRWFWLSYPLHFAALSMVLVPFIRYNNLLEWDFPGHYAAIWHIKTHLLPWFSGWNGFFYCGFPESIFYPPLAHYAAALLSYPLGIVGAMKLLVCLSILALPVAFYFFSRRWGLDDLQAAVCATWMTAQLFLCGEMFGSTNFGSDLKSALNIGLFANTLSLPFLFFFMGCCGGKAGLRRWKPPALLLGIIILVHPLSFLIAGIFWVALMAGELLRNPGDRAWRPLLKILGVGFLSGALWVVPFLAFRGYMNPESIPPLWPLAVQFLVLNGVVVALTHFSKVSLRPLIIFFILLANFMIVGSMWKITFQFPRLTIYLFFLLPMFVIVWLKSRFLLSSAGILAIAIGAFGYFNSGVNPRGVPDFAIPDFGRVEGRILSVAPPAHLPSYHVHHDLIPTRTQNEGLLGLFIESGINGRFIGNLTRMIDPNAHVWGTPSEFLAPELLKDNYPRYVKDRLRLFGVNHVYTDLKLEELLGSSMVHSKRYINSYPAPKLKSKSEIADFHRRYHVRENQLDFYLYTVDQGSIAEPLPYVPKSLSSDWKITNTIWFSQTRGVPVFTSIPLPPTATAALPGETVEILERSHNLDRLELRIDANHDIPVLLRIGYFPNWTLRLNGNDAPIYRASPDLMLIVGKGHAVLEYKRSWIEYLGLLLSVVGFVILLFPQSRTKHAFRK